MYLSELILNTVLRLLGMKQCSWDWWGFGEVKVTKRCQSEWSFEMCPEKCRSLTSNIKPRRSIHTSLVYYNIAEVITTIGGHKHTDCNSLRNEDWNSLKKGWNQHSLSGSWQWTEALSQLKIGNSSPPCLEVDRCPPKLVVKLAPGVKYFQNWEVDAHLTSKPSVQVNVATRATWQSIFWGSVMVFLVWHSIAVLLNF